MFFDAHGTAWPRIATRLIGGLGVMGMALTVRPVWHGLRRYAVSRRTREIGIRIAIGASPRRVLAMVLREGLTPAWWGTVAGLGFSVATARLLPALVQTDDRFDARTLFLVLTGLARRDAARGLRPRPPRGTYRANSGAAV